MEKLRLLATWFNVSGIFPWRMKMDKKSGNFAGFKFSYKYTSAWWCFVSAAMQFTGLVTLTCHLYHVYPYFITDPPTEDNIVQCDSWIAWKIIMFANCVNLASFVLLASLPRLITLQFGRLNVACNTIRQVDHAIRDQVADGGQFKKSRLFAIAAVNILPVDWSNSKLMLLTIFFPINSTSWQVWLISFVIAQCLFVIGRL